MFKPIQIEILKHFYENHSEAGKCDGYSYDTEKDWESKEGMAIFNVREPLTSKELNSI